MIILSPSKRQAEFRPKTGCESIPDRDRTEKLLKTLQSLSESELTEVLEVSDAIGHKAYQFYEGLDLDEPSMPAIELYQGDVYASLDAKTLSDSDLRYLQENLRIISPLYGLITPMTGIWPYRLEMVIKVPSFPDLKDYWKSMQEALDQAAPDYIFNLASKEYSICLEAPKGTQWIDIVFEDKNKKGAYQVMGIKAKRMRGEMLRYMAKHTIQSPEGITEFTHKNYEFSEAVSTPSKLVFRSR